MCNCNLMEADDFKRCVEFHGHICPGISIGYRAALEGMKKLNEERSPDEEIVAIVETDACSADAVQVLTGCTFGKGNFIYKDYGKMALTLFSRSSGKGVRVSMRPNVMTPNKEHAALMEKIRLEEASKEEKERFNVLHLKRSQDILEAAAEELFNIQFVQMEPPPKAIMVPSELCSRCKEPVMGTKLELIDNEKVCRGCL